MCHWRAFTTGHCVCAACSGPVIPRSVATACASSSACAMSERLMTPTSLGVRPGRTYKLGGSWALRAARERGNLLLTLLAVAAWIAVVISLDLARR